MQALERLATELGIIVVPTMYSVEEARLLLNTGKIRLSIAIGGKAICQLIPTIKRYSEVKDRWVQYAPGVLILAVGTPNDGWNTLIETYLPNL